MLFEFFGGEFQTFRNFQTSAVLLYLALSDLVIFLALPVNFDTTQNVCHIMFLVI